MSDNVKSKPLHPPVLRQPIKTVKRARALRAEMTLPEVLLWQELRKRPGGHKFRRQFPSQPYVLDFVCLQSRVGIEVDGEAHSRGDAPDRDAMRDRVLTDRGFHMMRLPAKDVLKNREGCVMAIVARCDALSPARHGKE